MALVLTKYPQISIKSKISKWNAVHHPITFGFQRQDIKIIKAIPSYVDGFGFSKPCTNIYFSGKLPIDVKINQNINYIVNDKKYTTKIITIESNMLVVEKIATTQLNGGFLILTEAYNSYYSEVQIWGVNASNTFELIGTTKCTANDLGIVKVNVQEWLQTNSVFQNKFEYNKINSKQLGEGGQYNITWREVFNGDTSNTTFTSLNPNYIFYWTNSSKQIKDAYSQNMAEYNPTNDNTRLNKAKFLSVFNKPTYFKGYPFSLSFIYSETLENKEVNRKESTKNINGVEIANTSDLLDMGGRGFVNRLMLKQSYNSNVKTLNVWLEVNDFATTKNPVQWKEDYSLEVFAPYEPITPVKYPFIRNTYTYE